MSEERKTVYSRGAEDGLAMGLVMTGAILLFGASSYVGLLSIPALIAMVCVPVVAYYLLGRSFRRGDVYPQDHSGRMTFSALWLEGICMFFFGSLVMAAVTYVSLRWWRPDFINHQFEMVIGAYGSLSDPQARELADQLSRMRVRGEMPGALDVTLMLLYGAVFTGSILSMIYALVIRRTGRRATPPPFNAD